MQYDDDLTDDQRKALAENGSELDQATAQLRAVHADARARLADVGLARPRPAGGDDDLPSRCLRCGCRDYTSQRPPLPPFGDCGTPNCSHPWIDHDIFHDA